MRRHRGFTFVEMLVVVAILALFAWLVIPGLAGARSPIAGPVETMIEADLQRAKTEAMTRATPVVVAAAEDGSAWWIAPSADPTEAIEGSRRMFGTAGLVQYREARLDVKSGFGGLVEGARVIAVFDPLGSRDTGTPILTLRNGGSSIASWTLPSGRTKLSIE
ncbi:MAG: hypothetical protein RIS86_272 [Planctomycetota bacterium]|jgi:prepilin-type N-terminal cleavage/methylation domain-containing protein